MATAEKCPNCGAFLKARRPGQDIRTCEFCGVELKSKTAQFDTQKALFDALRARAAESPGTRDIPDVARTIKRAAKIWIVFGVATTVITIVIGVIAAIAASQTRDAAIRKTLAGASAQLEAARVGGRGASDYEMNKAIAEKQYADAGGDKKLDALALQPFMIGLAANLQPDVALTRFRVDMVGPDGRANLTLSDSASASWYLRSPAASKVPAGTPIGAEIKLACTQYLSAGPRNITGEAHVSDTDVMGCKAPIARLPRCKLEDVWRLARAAGAPENAVASLNYESIHGSEHFFNHGDPLSFDPDVESMGLWDFQIDDKATGTRFSKQFLDVCGVRSADTDAPERRAEMRAALLGAKRPFAKCWHAQRRNKVKSTYSRVETRLLVDLEKDGPGSATVSTADPEFGDCVQKAVMALRLKKAAANASFDFALVISADAVLVGE